MERTIIKIEPEWNNAHCSLEGVDYDLPGWAELPSAFRSVWAAYRPFVDLTVDDTGAIIDMVQGTETGPDPCGGEQAGGTIPGLQRCHCGGMRCDAAERFHRAYRPDQ